MSQQRACLRACAVPNGSYSRSHARFGWHRRFEIQGLVFKWLAAPNSVLPAAAARNDAGESERSWCSPLTACTKERRDADPIGKNCRTWKKMTGRKRGPDGKGLFSRGTALRERRHHPCGRDPCAHRHQRASRGRHGSHTARSHPAGVAARGQGQDRREAAPVECLVFSSRNAGSGPAFSFLWRIGSDWCRLKDSNPRPTDYKSVALPLS